jgi:hypothetical protein
MVVYLPEPTHIPLSEEEMEAQARFIPSQFIKPLLNFETDHTLENLTAFLYESAGECVAEQLSTLVSPGIPWTYEVYPEFMTWRNASGKLWVSVTLPEYSVAAMPEIDYSNPKVIPIKDLSSFSLYELAMNDVPELMKSRAIAKGTNSTKKVKPEHWRQRVEVLVQRTPEYIQEARDELSRRYIMTVTPGTRELERKFFQALETCCSGVKALPITVKQLTSNGKGAKRTKFGEVKRKNRKTRKTRKTRKLHNSTYLK